VKIHITSISDLPDKHSDIPRSHTNSNWRPTSPMYHFGSKYIWSHDHPWQHMINDSHHVTIRSLAVHLDELGLDCWVMAMLGASMWNCRINGDQACGMREFRESWTLANRKTWELFNAVFIHVYILSLIITLFSLLAYFVLSFCFMSNLFYPFFLYFIYLASMLIIWTSHSIPISKFLVLLVLNHATIDIEKII